MLFTALLSSAHSVKPCRAGKLLSRPSVVALLL